LSGRRGRRGREGKRKGSGRGVGRIDQDGVGHGWRRRRRRRERRRWRRRRRRGGRRDGDACGACGD
jgi:hypothetical protein